jgi:hypothetical protein
MSELDHFPTKEEAAEIFNGGDVASPEKKQVADDELGKSIICLIFWCCGLGWMFRFPLACYARCLDSGGESSGTVCSCAEVATTSPVQLPFVRHLLIVDIDLQTRTSRTMSRTSAMTS